MSDQQPHFSGSRYMEDHVFVRNSDDSTEVIDLSSDDYLGNNIVNLGRKRHRCSDPQTAKRVSNRDQPGPSRTDTVPCISHNPNPFSGIKDEDLSAPKVNRFYSPNSENFCEGFSNPCDTNPSASSTAAQNLIKEESCDSSSSSNQK